ncbi:MAG TPA: GntR family transcriptional regulator [Clostridia bacterium]|nr:GntR family transcriptional regulator [Clostridia bacterium]
MFHHRVPLYAEIANEIRRRIREGIYIPGEQLPSEPELAEYFGVSRGTLREALSVLEKEGIILRRHGIGSFVEKNYHKVVAGMERLDPLIDTIRRSGYQAEDQVLSIYTEAIPSDIAKALEVETGSTGYMIESIRLANQEPVIYCFDVLPGWLVTDEKILEKRRQTESLSGFLRDNFRLRPKQFISTVSAVLPDRVTAKILGVDKRKPLILIEGTLYDDAHKPINFGRQYFRGDKYQFQLVRQ